MIVSGDIWTTFDYATLISRADAMAREPTAARAHLVYRAGETAWARAARAAGHRAADGLPMLIEQAALAEERWFDVPADREAMWTAVGGRPAWMLGASR